MSTLSGSPTTALIAGSRFWRWTLLTVLGVAVYVGIALGGYALNLVPGMVATVWLPAGFALALAFFGGRWMWPAILIGGLLAGVLHGASAGLSLMYGIGGTVEAMVARELLVKLDFRPQMDRVRDAFVLLIPVALLPTMLGAAISTLGLLVAANLPWSHAWFAWHSLWLGDATGIIIVAPLVFAWSGTPITWPRGWRAAEYALFGVTLVPLAWIAAGYVAGISMLVMPILVWAAIRLGPRAVTLANVVVAAARIWRVQHGPSSGGGTVTHRLFQAQTFVEIVAITTLILTAVMCERLRAVEALRASNEASSALARENDALGQIATLVAKEAARSEIFDATLDRLRGLFRLDTAAIVSNDAPGITSVMAGSNTGDAVAADITVHGALWGWLRVGPTAMLSDAARLTVGRFANLLGMAISSAEDRQRLLALASTDALTGIANHRVFHGRLADELNRCRRYERPLSVAVVDVDHFKSINDSFGHIVGDQVLVEITRRMADVLRFDAVIGRVGGDEFGVILPECDAETALVAMGRVRDAVSTEPIPPASGITLSIGICDTEWAESADALFELADIALYRVKDSGRDGCTAYQTEEA